MTAISAHTIGIKVRDDELDNGNRTSRLAQCVYGDVFGKAANDLKTYGPIYDAIQLELSHQRALEQRSEPELVVAAQPTGECYGLVASQIANLSGSTVLATDAHTIGVALGATVYAIDALRDFASDLGRSYNPLCLKVGNQPQTTPQGIRHECQCYIVECLEGGRKTVAQYDRVIQAKWDLIARRVVHLAGFQKRDAILRGVCCFPVGDGAVACDTDECGKCFCMCCLCVTCVTAGGKCC